MTRLWAVIRLIRFHNCVIASIAVWVGAYLTKGYSGNDALLPAALAVFGLCAFGNALNDLLDVRIDRISHPTRVLVQGQLSRRTAKIIAGAFALGGLVAGATAGGSVLALIAACTLLLAWYDFQLKSVVLIGNVSIGLLGGIPFVMGGVTVDSAQALELPGPLIPATFAFFFHLVREVVKDVQDMDGDREAGIWTFPQVVGEKVALWGANLLFGILGVLVYLPYRLGWYGAAYGVVALLVVIGPLLSMMIATAISPSVKRLELLSIWLKVGMALGMVALVLGKALNNV